MQCLPHRHLQQVPRGEEPRKLPALPSGLLDDSPWQTLYALRGGPLQRGKRRHLQAMPLGHLFGLWQGQMHPLPQGHRRPTRPHKMQKVPPRLYQHQSRREKMHALSQGHLRRRRYLPQVSQQIHDLQHRPGTMSAKNRPAQGRTMPPAQDLRKRPVLLLRTLSTPRLPQAGTGVHQQHQPVPTRNLLPLRQMPGLPHRTSRRQMHQQQGPVQAWHLLSRRQMPRLPQRTSWRKVHQQQGPMQARNVLLLRQMPDLLQPSCGVEMYQQ